MSQTNSKSLEKSPSSPQSDFLETPSPEPNNDLNDTTYRPTSTGKKKRGRKRKKQKDPDESDLSDFDDLGYRVGGAFPASKLIEYKWPPNSNDAQWYMVQEQVAQFLDIRGMQRRYPDLERRPLDFEEKKYLLDIEAVTETQCNMGLVALASDGVLEMMSDEFPDKYKEYMETQVEIQFQQAINSTLNDMKKLAESSVTQMSEDPQSLMREVVNETAMYNSLCNKLRDKNHSMYRDKPLKDRLVPRPKQIPQEPKPKSRYPVALFPGQYCDHVRKYSSEELYKLPLSTVKYFPS